MIYQLPWRSISRNVLLDPENVGVAVGILSLSCIQAKIFVIAYVLPEMAAIIDFSGHSCIEEYSHFSINVYLDLKNVLSVGCLVISLLNHVISFT